MMPWLLHALSQVLDGAADVILQIHTDAMLHAASVTSGGILLIAAFCNRQRIRFGVCINMPCIEHTCRRWSGR